RRRTSRRCWTSCRTRSRRCAARCRTTAGRGRRRSAGASSRTTTDVEREPIQPVVLVGGRSRRFGRDKLREPVEDGWLVDAPIRALRAVFGPVVAAVGACDPEVAARFDRVIEDRYPGAGPAGGVLSALQATGGAVFVLAGDLARITEREVRAVMAAAAGAPTAWAVMACGSRPE